MKEIFSKTHFPVAPGGNIYEFQEGETKFEVFEKGKYVIAITALCKNAKQNHSHDDDDLRIVIDDYEFGKYEIHADKVSWKGFGTASSFDGASLKGFKKTIYFFLELQKGRHNITFIADENPIIKEITVSHIEEDTLFEIKKLELSHFVKTDEKGIPFLSFVFLGVKPKNFQITSVCKSAAQKNTSDGDNLKVVVNGSIVQNVKAPLSDTYKNFYFSGDLNEGSHEILNITPESFEFLEDSVELWYDESPSVSVSIELFKNINNWWNFLNNEFVDIYYNVLIWGIIHFFKYKGYKYAEEFLYHSLVFSPKKLYFSDESDFALKIKKDTGYKDILFLIKKEIERNSFDGQIKLGKNEFGEGDEINFKNGDLFYSLHGLKKIHYKAVLKKESIYDIEITLIDVYDFKELDYKLNDMYRWWLVFGNNQINKAQAREKIKNFEINIQLNDSIKINNV
jgi:hypothetical protein